MTKHTPQKSEAVSSFVMEQWYVAGTSAEVTDKPFARMICGEPLVLYRRTDASIAVLEDRCPHRKAPLSLGEVVGDDIRCGYHGAQFDGTGACTLIPSQRELPVPSTFKGKAYAAIERHDLIFVWMGAAELADPALIPDWSRNTAEGWTAVHGYHHVKGNYQLVIDNLLDLSHTTYVHKTTLAGPGVDETPMFVDVEGDVVRTGRIIRNVDPVPMHRATMKIDGKIDRWQLSDFFSPCYILVTLGVEPAGTVETMTVPLFIVINSLTPETETTTHYFWSSARCRQIEDTALTQKFYDLTAMAFDEDAAMIEAQQRMIDTDRSGSNLFVFRGDRGGMAARRIISRKLKEQAAVNAGWSPAEEVTPIAQAG